MTCEVRALTYINDIIIPTKDEEAALVNLRRVLNLSKGYGLDINVKKFNFLKDRIQFLGNIIENQCVSPSVEKTSSFKDSLATPVILENLFLISRLLPNRLPIIIQSLYVDMNK